MSTLHIFQQSYKQGWEFAHLFSERIACFLLKMSEGAIHSKNERFTHLLIFGERPERFTHIAHQKKGNERFAHFFNNFFLSYIKHTNNKILDFFSQIFLSESLICLERPERFAHCCSFSLSDQSDSLTVTHLSWVIWANHSQSLIWLSEMSKWAMSKFPALPNMHSWKRPVSLLSKGKN